MALDRSIDFINFLYEKYENQIIPCSICKKPIPFRKFILQYTESHLYCSKKCREKDKTIKQKHFASKTEQAIFVFLKLEYPDYILRHNIKDFIYPYEIDFQINDIFIEYNGTFHISSKKKGMERKIEKTKLNDVKKKELICDINNKNLIRIWTEVGLYSRPKLFNDVLHILKKEINYIINNSKNTKCIEICIDKDEKIHLL